MNGREIQIRDAERLNDAALHPPTHGNGNGKNGNGKATKESLARVAPFLMESLDFLACSKTSITGLISRDAVCVAPDLSVEGLTTLLLERGLNAVPVIDENRRLVGIASTADLLREVQDRGDGEEERMPLDVPGRRGIEMELGDGFHATCLARATVEEIMTPCTFTVPETASVGQAAALMAFEGVGQLPVVGPGYKVVGTLTALDVMRWLAQQSGFLLPPAMRTRGDDHAAIAKQEPNLHAIGATIDRETSSLSRRTTSEEERPSIDGWVPTSAPAADLSECLPAVWTGCERSAR